MKNLPKSLFLLSCMNALLVSYVNAQCKASFTQASVSGLTITFSNTSTTTSGFPARMSFYWSFGDGTFSTLKDPVKTYTSGGWKAIQLTINDSFGCTKTVNDTVDFPPSTSQCSSSFTKTINGLIANFNNTSLSTNGQSSTLTYLWTFGDGTSSILKSPSKTYTIGGPKIVKLSISDSAQGCFSSKTDTLNLIAPVNQCAAKFTRSINGLTANFNNNSLSTNGSSSSLIYLWTFGDGTSSTLKNPFKTFTTGGVKIVKLSISDSTQGCFSSKTDTLLLTTPVNLCAARFTKSINGLTVTFNNNSTNTNGSTTGLTYLWSFGDGTSSTLKNPTKTYTTAGIKIVKLNIIDSVQGCWPSKTDTITINNIAPLCQASFNLAIDTVTAFNFYILNTSIVRPGTFYIWSFGDGDSSNLVNPTHTYAAFGKYKICLKIIDSICTSTFCDSIGMDTSGVLLKTGAFGFKVLNLTKLSTVSNVNNIAFKIENVKIYPNPTNSNATISWAHAKTEEVSLKLFDLSGKEIMSKTFISSPGENSETIDLSNLANSIYFLQYLSEGNKQVYKLIKN